MLMELDVFIKSNYRLPSKKNSSKVLKHCAGSHTSAACHYTAKLRSYSYTMKTYKLRRDMQFSRVIKFSSMCLRGSEVKTDL